jgi:hypothetical protein
MTQLSEYLQRIDELEIELDLQMSTESKRLFKSDIAIINEMSQQRIQSAKGAKYKLFMNVFTKVENYYFFLKNVKKERNKDKYFWEV